MLDESERRETMRLLLVEVLLLLNWENNHRKPPTDWAVDHERKERQKLCELLGRLNDSAVTVPSLSMRGDGECGPC